MPNGDPHFESRELLELDRFFAPLAETLEAFAARHNLLLEKYYHQNRGWDFSFRHPKGGIGRIQVLRARDEDVLIAGHWAVSDYRKLRRKTCSWELVTLNRRSEQLGEALRTLLEDMVEADPSRLVPDGTDYSRYWKPELIDEIQASEQALPLPILT